MSYYNMLKYTEFISLLEFENINKDRFLANDFDKLDVAKDFFEKHLNAMYVVPSLESFTREDEPHQTKFLFYVKDKAVTFNLNIDNRGNIYSVDFWTKNDTLPKSTMYVKKGSTHKFSGVLNTIVKAISETDLSVDAIRSLLGINEGVTDSIKVDVPKHQKTSSEYEYSDNPKELIADLEKYVKMVIKGTQPSLVITGSAGFGKTHLVLDELEKAGVEYEHIKGRSTAAGLYISLYKNNGKFLIFDDCDKVLKDPDAEDILKSALDSYDKRTITWASGKPLKFEDEEIPHKFEFTGSAIFISNLPQSKINKALKSRSFVLEVALKPKDMLERMESKLDEVMTDVSYAVKSKAFDIIEEVFDSGVEIELNMRTLQKAIKIVNEIDDTTIARRLINQQCSYR